MPPKSEAQRRLMRAAAKGKVKGVPKSVARKYNRTDKGGKLPKRKGRK